MPNLKSQTEQKLRLPTRVGFLDLVIASRKPRERSSAQQQHNRALATASAAWNALMANEKSAWQEKAKALGYRAGYRLWLSVWFMREIHVPERPMPPV
ncbi:hypothetical protein CCP4SC76_2580024 [Gammaproteobacteria bacterium]